MTYNFKWSCINFDKNISGFGTTSTPGTGGLFGQQTQQNTAPSLFGQPSTSGMIHLCIL